MLLFLNIFGLIVAPFESALSLVAIKVTLWVLLSFFVETFLISSFYLSPGQLESDLNDLTKNVPVDFLLAHLPTQRPSQHHSFFGLTQSSPVDRLYVCTAFHFVMWAFILLLHFQSQSPFVF